MTSKTINETTKLLIKAKGKIKNKRNWCQHISNKTTLFGMTQQYCAWGALYYSQPSVEGFKAASVLLYGAAQDLGYVDAITLNDQTNHTTVMKMYDLAIQNSMK